MKDILTLPLSFESWFDLLELLEVVDPFGRELTWAVIALNEGPDFTGVDVDREYEDSVLERPLTWVELQGMARRIHQVIWGTFVGTIGAPDCQAIPTMFLDEWGYLDRAKPLFFETVEIALQAIDSSFWFVYAKDEALRDRILTRFEAGQIRRRYEVSEPEERR